MASELLEIEPRELKFVFELKKQSSCTVQLTNETEQYVAFKVKTTSPKRYCVRPNIGVILPKSTLDFTVTLQAMREAPTDMQCKDKFLIQSTVVPLGTTEEELKAEFFSKESGRYIEDKKLRVVFVSPPHSPVLQPLNGSLKQEKISQTSLPKEVTDLKEFASLKENISDEDVPVAISWKEDHISKQSEAFREACNLDMLEPAEVKGIRHLNLASSLEEFKVSENIEELRSKINILQTRLIESEKVSAALEEEKSSFFLEREKLKQELAMMQHKHVKNVRVGFPFLFVCFIGFVGMVVGYMMRRE